MDVENAQNSVFRGSLVWFLARCGCSFGMICQQGWIFISWIIFFMILGIGFYFHMTVWSCRFIWAIF